MRKVRVFSLLLLFIIGSLFFDISNVFADDISCEYDNDLVINYTDDGFKIDRQHLIDIGVSSEFASSVLDTCLPFVDIDIDNIAEADLYIDQSVMQEINGNCACPSNMYVCHYYDISSTLLNGLNVDNFVTLITQDFFEGLRTFATFGSVKHNIYVYDQGSYDSSDLRQYETDLFVIGNENVETIMDLYSWCYDSLFGNEVVCGIGSYAASTTPVVQLIYLVKNGYNAFFIRKFACEEVNYNGSCDTIDVNCSSLTSYTARFRQYINEYKSCTNDTCKRVKRGELDTVEANVKSYCGSVVKNYNYSDAQKSCLEQCFNIKSTLSDLKKGTDLYQGITSSSKTCSVSDKIINWLSNIFRWGKFIAPALVIILSMLDFIKAIASQNEDEMKKVQGKFINRLIVAALVFLLPFILEFALRAFNLLSDNPYCNLI